MGDFQNYQEGTHVLNSLNGEFQMSLATPIFRGLEGYYDDVQVAYADWDPSAPECEFEQGCKSDGSRVDWYWIDESAGEWGWRDPEIEFNWPTMWVWESGTYTFSPSDAEFGDWATLTITDGEVMEFSWGTVGSDSTALAGFNERTFGGWPVKLESIEVGFAGTTPYQEYDGTTYFAQNDLASASVTLVPEPETYAMMLAGLGMIGAMVRRRRRRQA